MSAIIVVRPRVIRDVWMAVYGEDPTHGRLTGPEQHRVLCPFHSERDPSCDISIAKNVFTCRSCDAKGGALDVVIQAGNARTKSEAITWLQAHGVRVC